MSKRTDTHRPAEFDPSDYRVVDYLDNKRPEPPVTGDPEVLDAYSRYVKLWEERIFEHFPNWRTGGTDHQLIFQCNHCGQPHIRWVAVVEHIPTGAKLAFGETCANRVELPGRDAFRAKFIKDRAALEQAALENAQRKAVFATHNADVIEFLKNYQFGEDIRPNEFLDDMVRTLDRKGELTENQANAVRKFIDGFKKQQEKREAERAALADAPPLEEGRRVIEGEVVSTKWTEDFGYGSQFKMLVKEENGNKVWGTVPSSLGNIKPGQRVKFTAKVERSKDDEHFGFYSRPTKAEVLDTGQES